MKKRTKDRITTAIILLSVIIPLAGFIVSILLMLNMAGVFR